MENKVIDPKKTALILMDFQKFILENFISLEQATHVTQNAAKLLQWARQAGVLVIHVNVSFRQGYPEINSRNVMFGDIKANKRVIPGGDEMKIYAPLAPQSDEPIVGKHRISAFSGSDFDMILRANNIEELVLAGVATSHVVLSTFNQAFDLDYGLTVIEDACTDGDLEMHDILIKKHFPRHAMVMSAQEFIEKNIS
ncbi:cysteine hydrolase family protein [Bartonella sp. HY761]|uniref:cysteine hydrolase family protein n=1 Tax=Bartonella sp. HY761 TaxID=2979330 RepID=UPI0021FA68B2|nr:cysteine hydrolase [Bartonella sp. HY761]UXN06112.1 cysteine hydrolase [Bartonella sp. HY761]